nr:trans-2-enoyl-CoA reductase [uncultured bacterium]
MIIKPRVRGFLCTTTHPVGCDANVKRQIDYVNAKGAIINGPKRVLVIGASTGYGLASRITAAFGCGAATLGIFFEKEGSETKPGTAGWYNSAAFHKYAHGAGLYAKSINGDAFSDEIKRKAIDTIKADLGQVDLVVYSLASPRRLHPVTGVVHSSTLKPIGADAVQKGVNTDKEEVQDFHLPAATQEEIDNTVAVMGGEDWQMWIDALDAAGVLADGAKTTAYTYIGEKLTWDIYWHGTIGAAKKDLDKRVIGIRQRLAAKGGDARVSVLKAVVTQASAAIPAMPIYLALLFKVMKEKGVHEGCIEQVDGLFRDSLYNAGAQLG